MSAKWAISGFAIFIGSICLIYRLVMAAKLKKQVRATGEVVSCTAGRFDGSGFKTKFRISPADREPVDCTVQTNHGYAVGDRVPVLYPEKFPTHATIYEPFIHKLFGSWILYAMLALLIVAQMGLIPDD